MLSHNQKKVFLQNGREMLVRAYWIHEKTATTTTKKSLWPHIILGNCFYAFSPHPLSSSLLFFGLFGVFFFHTQKKIIAKARASWRESSLSSFLKWLIEKWLWRDVIVKEEEKKFIWSHSKQHKLINSRIDDNDWRKATYEYVNERNAVWGRRSIIA